MGEPTFSPMNDSMGFQDLDPRNITKEHGATHDFQDLGQTNVLNAGVTGDGSPQNFPDIEVLRDTVHGFSGESLPQLMYADHGNAVALENSSSGDIRNENETLSPIMDDMLPSRGQSLPSQQRSEPTTSGAFQQAPEIFEAYVSVGNMPVDLAIQSTPPAQQPQLRRRKRKFFFDESIVLSNRFLKKMLEDSSDLLRKKRKSPCSKLDIWKKNNRLRKELVFNEPLVTGLSTDICKIFSKKFFSSRPHLLLEEETIPEPGVPNSPALGAEATTEPRVVPSPGLVTEATRDREPSPSIPEIDREIELMRDFEGHIGGDNLFHKDEYVPFPFRNNDSIPIPSNNLGLGSVPLSETIPGSGVFPSPSVATSNGTYGSELETPRTLLVEGLGMDNTGLLDIPETMNSAEADELYFLEADNNQPPGSQGTQTGHDLLPRTRAVFQYLERHSPSNPMSEDTPGDLSLNKILEGRSRKLCARMFYETLVLKTNQVVDVRQEIPYGDITLTLKSPPKTDA
ncbi:sister chromatid cohesion 1 protein 3-like [Tripterygium wilfordii]|uniref:Sister chromatid cohesion 1 protein 3-like n=2 Tax=Tripterygium wilfordii TaxID=458696 RepID=A0A7J7CQP1_TRIWF|nr:sister chromatid cohesion 1 protein 3-like [Tripterygium wilfordii]